MKRRAMIGSIAGAGALAAAGTAVRAQDSTDLETRVAELESQMAAVLKRLDTLEGNGSSSDDGTAATPGDDSEGMAISGTGDVVTDSFQLEEGRYKVTGTCQIEDQSSSLFSVLIYGPGDDDRDLLFNEVINDDFSGEVTFRAAATADYYLEVQARTAWSFTFEKR